MMFVVESDAPCPCGMSHGYATRMCDLICFVDYATARYVAQHIEGSVVRQISEVPKGISYHLYVHKGGRPDESLPKTERSMSRR